MNSRIWFAGLALSAGLCSFSFGQVSGTAKFDGKAPEPQPIDMSGVKECAAKHKAPVLPDTLIVTDGKVANVVVNLEGEDLKGEVPKQPVLDQDGCMYKPHVVAMMADQPLLVKNSDDFLHNVHSLAIDNDSFNFGQATKNPGQKTPAMKVAERFDIKCDVHPWMSAKINVFPHPFFAVTKPDGTFTIPTKGLADGKYAVTAWHEKLGEQKGEVTVKDGKGTVDFSFKPEGAADAGDQSGPAAETKLVDAAVKATKALKADCCKDEKKAIAQK